MAVRRLETTCPDCGGQAGPWAGTITHRGGCDGSWHLRTDRHVPLESPQVSAGLRRTMLTLGAVQGAVAGAVLLAWSWWWLALLLPSIALLVAVAVRR